MDIAAAGIDCHRDGHLLDGEFVHRLHSEVFERHEAGSTNGLGHQVGGTADRHEVGRLVLANGLETLGILPTSADEALKDENQFYKRYSLHNVSHMLGLDVHDCAKARLEVYKYGKLQAGMVLTVEPGLYFQTDDLTVPKKYRGIGVRVEDDVLVTAKGCKVLSSKIPRTVKDVEAWMKSLWARKRA